MIKKIRLPELGTDIISAIVADIHIKVGDKVKKDQEIIEVVTDKANFNIESEYEGIVKEICVEKEEEVKINQKLIEIEVK